MSNSLTIFKKGLILVAVPLAFQLGLIAVLAVMQTGATEAERWSFHSKEVLGQAQTVLTWLVNLESGSRGYMLTGDAAFTGPSDRAMQEVPAALERLDDLVSDNPPQRAAVAEIASKTRKLLEWHTANMRLAREGFREEAVVTRAKTLDGIHQMDAIRTDMDAFLTEEQRLDRDRTQSLRNSQHWLQGILVAGTIASVVATVILALVFNRGIGGRLATLIGNAHHLAEGKALSSPLAGADELGQLDRAYHEMAEKLASSTAALRDQSHLLRSVLDNMSDGVVVSDPSGKFLVFNPAAERMLAVGPVETTPDAWTQAYGVYLPDQTTPFPPSELPLARAMRGEAVDAVEVYVRHAKLPEGSWLSVSARPLADRSGSSGGGIVVFREINDLKRREEEIRRLNEDLERRVVERTADLAEANRELEQKNQENEMFVYSVSHDLRAPLVNLQGFAEELNLGCQDLRELLVNETVPQSVRERGLALLDKDFAKSMRFIQAGVLRLSSIIDALLRLSRAGRVDYRWQSVEVKDVVGRIVESLNGTISERGAAVTIEPLPPAWADPTGVEQVFANLVGNALNYLDPQRPGVIEVGSVNPRGADNVEEPGAFHTYFVRDNGLGIPEAYTPKVFQAFQRLHPRAAKGEGIGLVLVRRIVERHGGRIRLESVEGVGTTFFITLPAAHAEKTGNREVQNDIRARRDELAPC